MTHVNLYSDGAARGNPGPGGYGAVLTFTDAQGQLHTKELSQGYICTTNNRMELLGVIRGLEALKHACEVDVYSDSKYVVDAFNQHLSLIHIYARRKKCDLIVMGRRGLGGLRQFVGSVTKEVLHRVDLPVMTIK